MFVFVLAHPAGAVTDATLIGPDLETQEVRVAGLRDGVLTYFDAQRTLRSADVDTFVQLRSIGDAVAPAHTPGPCVWLTDGQRLTGQWVGPTDDGSGLRWRHDLVGELTLSLDEVVFVSWRDEPSPASEAPVSDTLTLINNDAMTGFVSSLAEDGVTLIPDTGGDPVTIPYARLALLTLTNPLRSTADAGHRVLLADGSYLAVQDLELTDALATWVMNPPGDSPRTVEVSIEEVARVDFGSEGMRLVGLGGLPISVLEPARVFGLTEPIRADGRAVRVHAPATIGFDLPQGATRFSAEAFLDTQGAPARIADWADFQVVLTCEGEEVGRVHLTGAKQRETINVPVYGPRLEIHLEPGVNGPILDRLLLREVSVLVWTPTGDAAGSLDR